MTQDRFGLETQPHSSATGWDHHFFGGIVIVASFIAIR